MSGLRDRQPVNLSFNPEYSAHNFHEWSLLPQSWANEFEWEEALWWNKKWEGPHYHAHLYLAHKKHISSVCQPLRAPCVLNIRKSQECARAIYLLPLKQCALYPGARILIALNLFILEITRILYSQNPCSSSDWSGACSTIGPPCNIANPISSER